jgi:ELWxxDGT repeat protein
MPASASSRIRRTAAVLGIAGAALLTAAFPALAGPVSSEPETFSSAKGVAYFWASSPGHGIELWRTDGTAAGTRLFQEFRSGSASSEDGSMVQLVNGRLWVIADDGVRGREPYWIDPATGKRTLLKDIRPGAQGSGGEGADEYRFIGLGTKVLFPADDGVHGREWWVTNGTKAGTKLLKDANQDSSWLPQWWAKVGGKMLFNAFAGGEGTTWATDGTTGGTSQISEVSGGDQTYRPAPLLDGWAIMNGFTPELKSELYRSDGTTVELIKEISVTDYAKPVGFVKLGDKVVFTARDDAHGTEVWTTKGTEGTTVRISDINPSGDATDFIDGAQMVRIGSLVLFVATDGTGDELWKTDGVTVTRVRDIRPSGGSNPDGLVASGGKVFFQANDGTNGYEPWVSDGTKAGTFMLKNIKASGSSFPEEFTPIAGGRVVFAATDGTHGRELWVSDGTKAGTKLLKDIR